MLLLVVPAPDPTQVTQTVGESFKLSEKNEGLKATRALSIVPNDPCTITRVSLMPIVVDCIAHIDSHRLSEYEIFVINIARGTTDPGY